MAIKSKVTVKWNGKQLADRYEQAIADGLTAGAIYLQREITRNLGYPSPSMPFEYPGKDTGNLRRSITFSAATPGSLVAAAGVSANNPTENTYGLHLEFGTSKMLPRPFLMRTLVDNYAAISSVVVATARRRMKA